MTYNDLKVGDLIYMEFFPNKWYDKIIAKLQQIFDRTKYHHVAVYIGNGRITEMSNEGLREIALPIQDDIKLGIQRICEIDSNKLLKCVEEYRLSGRGKKYPKPELWQVAFRTLIKFCFRKENPPMLVDGENDICTAYAREIYRMYGKIIHNKKNPSVGELERFNGGLDELTYN